MLSLSCICLKVRLLFSALGVAFLSLTVMDLAQADETVAYCDSPLYAVNVYRDDGAESSETSLRIRIFWREKSLIFADLPAMRSHFIREGFTYTSQSELSDDYSNALWTLFVPDAEGESCLLFRNGTAFDSGDVTRRQLP